MGCCIVEPNSYTTRHRQAISVRRIRDFSYRAFTEAHFGPLGQSPLRIVLGKSVKWKEGEKNK